MSPLREYHYNWLKAHPERTEEWLRDKLSDGFDVHHIDLDRNNNAPENLVLIEHSDHMRIHGLIHLKREIGAAKEKRAEQWRRKAKTTEDRIRKDKEVARREADKARNAQLLINRKRIAPQVYRLMALGYTESQVFRAIDPSLFPSPKSMKSSAMQISLSRNWPWPPKIDANKAA